MIDDWKMETQSRLNNSAIYKELETRCAGDKAVGPSLMSLVNDVAFYSYQRTKTIISHMGEFTLHDSDHLFRVLFLMERLLSEQNLKEVSIPELMLLVLTAFLHDIGMSPDEKDVLAWKKVWDSSPVFDTEEEKEGFDKFNRFYNARPEQQRIIREFVAQGKNSNAETIKAYLITEFIRQTHTERARDIIAKDWNGKILYRDVDLTVELAQICYSHNEDPLHLLDLDKNYLCGPGTVACLPLVGVILRLSDILDFDAKRTPSILYSHLYVRHPISIQEWNRHRAVEAWEINTDLIQFSAKCTHPAIEASIHEFCDLIDHELSLCNNVISTINEFNKSKSRLLSVKIPYKVNREKIETKKDIYNKPTYIYRETKFNLSKNQVIELLMGTKLYGNPEVALRELLQNSIDACLLRQAQEKKWGNLYSPEINVKYLTENGEEYLEITDNGTGMDQYIIDNYYSKVGSSFYKSTDFYNLKAESNAEFVPTSRFGIGILSSFMVADTLIVDTKRVYGPHKSSESLNITVEGQESIFWIRPGNRNVPGTTTRLVLRKSNNPWEKMSEEDFIASVESVLPNPPFKIQIITLSYSKTRDEKSFHSVTAETLKDYSWAENENIRIFEIPISTDFTVGSAVVAILESHGKPVDSIEINSKEIEIEGNTYSLEKALKTSGNKIVQASSSITINDDGCIRESSSTEHFAESKSRLSLHGIDVPTTLFPEAWRMNKNQVKISWPFPLIIVADICNNGDLDLNSSRTEIIMTEKWIYFEEELAYVICSKIQESVDTEYWLDLCKILNKNAKSPQFIRAIAKINKN